jgi:hypothetical protein
MGGGGAKSPDGEKASINHSILSAVDGKKKQYSKNSKKNGEHTLSITIGCISF